jgi:hypothetical protein
VLKFNLLLMRVKLCLQYSNVSLKQMNQTIPNKVLFPLDLVKMTTIADLKVEIERFIFENILKDPHEFNITTLTLDDYTLFDHFKISELIRNDDEIK